MNLLFSYGTLQQENVQLATFGRLLAGTAETLVGYVLDDIEITDAEVVAKSGKRFHPILKKTGKQADEVHGMVFQVTDAELALADAYEVDAYKRVSVQFKSGISAWIYADARDA